MLLFVEAELANDEPVKGTVKGSWESRYDTLEKFLTKLKSQGKTVKEAWVGEAKPTIILDE